MKVNFLYFIVGCLVGITLSQGSVQLWAGTNGTHKQPVSAYQSPFSSIYPKEYTSERIKADSLAAVDLIRELRTHPGRWRVLHESESGYHAIGQLNGQHAIVYHDMLWFAEERSIYFTLSQSDYISVWLKTHFN